MTTKAEFDIVTALRSMEFFHDMDPKYLRRLATIADQVTYEKGDLVYKEGDLDRGMYLIQEGEVVIEMKAPDQGYAPVLTVGKGQLFGWSSLFPGQRKHARARVLKNTRAYLIDGDRLNHLFESDHELENVVMRRMIKLVGERVYATRQKLVECPDVPLG
jgi:CRP-like cAMP-binding protein